ncbi:MAG: hypothetical protein ACXWG5_10830, partial [Candidatus Aminicenantales bacterium]
MISKIRAKTGAGGTPVTDERTGPAARSLWPREHGLRRRTLCQRVEMDMNAFEQVDIPLESAFHAGGDGVSV